MRDHYIPSRPPSLGNPPRRLWGMAGCRCRISPRQSIISRIVAFGKGETMPRKAMPYPDPEQLSSYLESVSGTPLRLSPLTPLGATVATCAVKGYGYGVPVMVEYEVSGERRKAVLETTSPGAFGHEHMSDRAQMLLWDHEAYNHLPLHARSLDVGGVARDGSLLSLGNVEELFLLVEHVKGSGYIQDLARLQAGENLTDHDPARADAPCAFLADIQREKRPHPRTHS